MIPVLLFVPVCFYNLGIITLVCRPSCSLQNRETKPCRVSDDTQNECAATDPCVRQSARVQHSVIAQENAILSGLWLFSLSLNLITVGQ